MSLNRREATEVLKKESEGTTLVYDNLPVGDNEGRLVYVADLGLQSRVFKGTFKGNFQQLALGIEIPDHPMKNEDGESLPRILWTKPFYIYEKMGETGHEYAYYSAFDTSAQAETVPDWDAQLGKPINVVVEHNQGKGENSDKTYDNIKALTPIPAKYQEGVAVATITPAIGDADDAENVVTKALYGLVKHVYDKRVQGSVDTSDKEYSYDPVAEQDVVERPY
jgi:hypothetical protein